MILKNERELMQAFLDGKTAIYNNMIAVSLGDDGNRITKPINNAPKNVDLWQGVREIGQWQFTRQLWSVID